jgi:hypothetical protein
MRQQVNFKNVEYIQQLTPSFNSLNITTIVDTYIAASPNNVFSIQPLELSTTQQLTFDNASPMF